MNVILKENIRNNFRNIKKKMISLFIFLIHNVIERLPDNVFVGVITNIQRIKKMDYSKHEIVLEINSPKEFMRLRACEREPWTVEWIESFTPGDIMFDIGANVGSYSLIASKFFEGKVTIYAFEPGFPNYPKLCKNIFINNCQENITPLPIALSNLNKIDYFYYNNLSPGGALHAFGNPVDHRGNDFKFVFKQKMLSCTIDEVIKRFNVPPPNHMKIDVDGNELLVLRGAEETLKSEILKSAIVEIHEGNNSGTDKIIEFFKERNMIIQSKHKNLFRKVSSPFSNESYYIFIRKA